MLDGNGTRWFPNIKQRGTVYRSRSWAFEEGTARPGKAAVSRVNPKRGMILERVMMY